MKRLHGDTLITIIILSITSAIMLVCFCLSFTLGFPFHRVKATIVTATKPYAENPNKTHSKQLQGVEFTYDGYSISRAMKADDYYAGEKRTMYFAKRRLNECTFLTPMEHAGYVFWRIVYVLDIFINSVWTYRLLKGPISQEEPEPVLNEDEND